MVQVLDFEKQEDIFVIIPKIDIKVKKIPLKKQLRLQALKYRKPAKYHEELICINKLKSKLEANLYRNKFFLF